ncbi:hypothetical protein [uncultured Winogradskyella sp.]|uniref:hypothetical protein n=1 Tax=uncultured Winogradskyella sp. TaxID=395353 RepID=UPI002628C905|nr:hypothetical protein [uncultured Winogradskyella sp.]
MRNKTILVGCDETDVLLTLVDSLSTISNYSCVTSVRTSDLIRIIKSIEPAIIIISFRNNQLAINNVSSFINNLSIPILCLTRRNERNFLKWNPKNIVLTHPIENAIKPNYLVSRVNSILLLLKQNSYNTEQSFAEQSIGKHFGRQNKSLSRYVMELDQKTGALNRIKKRIKELYSDVNEPIRHKLISIVNSIQVNTKDEKHWEDFKMYFERISPNFLKHLNQKHPELTPKDIKYCCYLKMNMSNNDIGHVLGINLESVRTHKYRLKRKLQIAKSQNLQTYIKSIVS